MVLEILAYSMAKIKIDLSYHIQRWIKYLNIRRKTIKQYQDIVTWGKQKTFKAKETKNKKLKTILDNEMKRNLQYLRLANKKLLQNNKTKGTAKTEK